APARRAEVHRDVRLRRLDRQEYAAYRHQDDAQPGGDARADAQTREIQGAARVAERKAAPDFMPERLHGRDAPHARGDAQACAADRDECDAVGTCGTFAPRRFLARRARVDGDYAALRNVELVDELARDGVDGRAHLGRARAFRAVGFEHDVRGVFAAD